jgi:hypothetical protein
MNRPNVSLGSRIRFDVREPFVAAKREYETDVRVHMDHILPKY